MSSTTNWSIKDHVIKDIGDLFTNEAALYRCLVTNNKTWKGSIEVRKGVRRQIARNIVREFLKILKNIKEKKWAQTGVDEQFGETLLKKYGKSVDSLDATDYIEEMLEN